MFLKDLHAFRGFAIINIVMAHTGGGLLVSQYFAVEKTRTPSWENCFGMSEMLFHDSTLYFSLISGLLFSTVLAKKGWLAFSKSKILNVLAPYVFMSILLTLVGYGWLGEGFIFFPFESMSAFLSAVGLNILKGTADAQFWYIPTLAVIFLLTPFAWFLVQRSHWILLAIGVLPLIFARTAIEFSPQNVLYFFGAYCIGMAVGVNYERYLEYFSKWRYALATLAVGSSIFLFLMVRKTEPMTSLGGLLESIFYIQKMSIAALVLGLFNKYKDRLPSILAVLGTYAFPIYFMHFFFIRIYTANLFSFLTPPLSWPVNLALDLLSLAVCVSASILVAFLVKKATGRFSRNIVGA